MPTALQTNVSRNAHDRLGSHALDESTPENLAALPEGAVCWVFSADLQNSCTGVWDPKRNRFAVHRSEHCSIPNVVRFIVLPK
jgi:hypothetical protein